MKEECITFTQKVSIHPPTKLRTCFNVLRYVEYPSSQLMEIWSSKVKGTYLWDLIWIFETPSMRLAGAVSMKVADRRSTSDSYLF